MKPDSKFKQNQAVRKHDAPDVVGVVIAERWNPQLRGWAYRIQFGNGVREIPEDSLEPLPARQEPWEDFAFGAFGAAPTFRTMMTFERLRKPPSRIAASFGSAKATFYPFQFKPLLKLLENPIQRLLIADEVGLGKTIEAGYILRELRARDHVERALIVVPSRLREKWRSELSRRFDEQFELVSARDVLGYLDTVERGGSLRPFLWIASLESLRNPDVIDRLRSRSPQIDLVVFDEAHRLRNRSTLQHRLGEALSQVADAMLFLTATPVQTSQENLFTLLHLLDPETFENSEVFMRQLDAQRPVLRALQAIRTSSPDGAAALEQLDAVAQDPAYESIAQSDFFVSIGERLRKIQDLERKQRVELERDLSELCFTSGFISRTRKADVITDRPRRTPQSILLEFTPEERAIYNHVEHLCALIDPYASGWGHSMSVLMAYRYTASCIPAAIEYLRHRLDGEGSIFESLKNNDIREETEDERGWQTGDENAQTRARGSDRHADDFEEEVHEFEFNVRNGFIAAPPVDTKFASLEKLLRGLWEDDHQEGRAERKVVVFSFFKRTLRYLEQRLKSAGIGCVRIDGSIPIPDREAAIEKFAGDRETRVLLSSEVGGEGLDLQFASVLVNYDLPWNPMVLEQRIGRLDRIGQKSERILIFNFAIKDTVEERILLRLYERIGIFEDTIGEIDPILGRKIEELTLKAFTGNLTPEEQERMADENADAAVREWHEARRLTEEADALLAADQAFLDEVESLIGHRRLPDAAELASFFRNFVEKRYPGSKVGARLATRVETIHFVPQFARDLEEELESTRDTTRVASMIRQGAFQATFNSAAFSEHPSAEVIHGRHPLIRFALKRLEQETDWTHRCFALRVPWKNESKKLAFSVFLVEYSGTRPHTDLITIAYDIETGSVLDPETSHDYIAKALDAGETFDPPPKVDPSNASEWRQAIEDALDKHLSEQLSRERRLNSARSARRRAAIEQTLRAKVKAAEQRLSKSKQSAASDFPIRMAAARVERAREKLESFRSEVEETREVHYETEHVAVGLLHLTPETGGSR